LSKELDLTFKGISYSVLAKGDDPWDRGTAFFGDELIPDYPRMPRILHLEEGLKRNITSPFYLEEKIDGYNLRVFYREEEDRVFSLTRSGRVCPFSLDKVLRLPSVLALIRENPHLILCGEMAGYGNPYNNSPFNLRKKLGFYGFDIMKKNTDKHEFLPVEEKYELFNRYGIPSVPVLAKFSLDEYEEIRQLILFCDLERKEGFVIKPVNSEEQPLKYVTFFSTLSDIFAMEDMMFESPPEYYTNRIKRGAYFIEEHLWDYPYDEFFHMRRIREAIRKVKREEKLFQEVEVFFYDEEMANLFLEHLGDIKIQVHGLRKKVTPEGRIIIIFKKEMMRSADIIKNDLSGNTRID
jgi:putative ATP-dependent DNA ligase